MSSLQKHDSCPFPMHVVFTSLVQHWIQFSVFFLYLFGSSAEMRWTKFLRLRGQAFEVLRYEIPDLWNFLRKRQLVWSDGSWLMFASAEKNVYSCLLIKQASFFSLISIEGEILFLWTVLRQGFFLLWLPK